MPGSTPPTSQLDWLISTTAMIVLFRSRATRDLLKSFGWGIAALHRLNAATKLPPPRRPPHRIFQYAEAVKLVVAAFSCADCLGRVGVLRFRPPRFERQAIRRSLAP